MIVCCSNFQLWNWTRISTPPSLPWLLQYENFFSINQMYVRLVHNTFELFLVISSRAVSTEKLLLFLCAWMLCVVTKENDKENTVSPTHINYVLNRCLSQKLQPSDAVRTSSALQNSNSLFTRMQQVGQAVNFHLVQNNSDSSRLDLQSVFRASVLSTQLCRFDSMDCMEPGIAHVIETTLIPSLIRLLYWYL